MMIVLLPRLPHCKQTASHHRPFNRSFSVRTAPCGRHARASAQRGVLILPGLGNSAADYADLKSSLQELGLAVEVANVARVDWLRNAAGLTDPNYWKGTLKPRPTVDWYLQRVDAAAKLLQEAVDGERVTMLTHSAGGWLGRLYLLDVEGEGFDRLVSLGSPHVPPPPGVLDQTRGILNFCSDVCPGAHHSEIMYITIASKFIKGAPLLGEGSLAQKLAGAGYKQVCGDAEVWGDGIIPLPAAHLDGAINVDLEGVYHSPLGAQEASDGSPGRPWYGSPGVLEQWVHFVLEDPIKTTYPPTPADAASTIS